VAKKKGVKRTIPAPVSSRALRFRAALAGARLHAVLERQRAELVGAFFRLDRLDQAGDVAEAQARAIAEAATKAHRAVRAYRKTYCAALDRVLARGDAYLPAGVRTP
jgi:hypothetical protein